MWLAILNLPTRVDDDLYEDFRKKFPDLDISSLSKDDINGNAEIKEKWRQFIMPYEHRIALYNFGTLLRLDSKEDYSEHNSYFGTSRLVNGILVSIIIRL